MFRLVPNRGLTPVVTHRWFYYNDLAHRFSPLLGPSHQWRVLRDQTVDQLYDSLELNDIEVRIEVPNSSVDGCPCMGCFRSLMVG
jgi:hypothetical protein